MKNIFGSIEGIIVYVLLLASAVCGALEVSAWSIALIAISMSIVSWHPRWSKLAMHADDIDAEYRALARLVWARDPLKAVTLVLRSWFGFGARAAQLVHNTMFAAIGYFVGRIVAAVF